MPVSGDPSRAYRPDIDGLRALAIVLVIAYHYFGLPGGYVGVDVFFVISGYLITGLLLAELEDSRLSFLGFYARRVRRILPALLIVLVTSLLVGWLWLLPHDLRVTAQEAGASALYVFNFVLWHQFGYFDISASTKPLLHLWSLAVEEQFYLVWPAFLLLANRLRRRADLGILAVLVASFLVNLITVQNDQVAAFYSPLSRLWELAAGALLAQLQRSRTGARPSRWQNCLPIVGLLMILGAATLYDSNTEFPGFRAAVPVFGAVLIVAGGARAWLNRDLFARRPMVVIGKLSYSVYLWHWPVLVVASLLFASEHFRYLNIACLAISGLLAWGTYCWCERPIRRIPVGPGNAWKFVAVGIGSSVTLATSAFLMSSGTLARESDSMLITREYQRSEHGCTFPGLDAHGANTAIFAPCEVVRFPGRPIVVLVGDSHAAALFEGLRPYLDVRKVNLFEYTATGCMPMTIVGATSACAATYEYILAMIKRDKADLVILSAHHLTWTAHLPGGYEQSVIQQMAQLRKSGAQHVLIVGQMPIWGGTLPRILNQEYLRLGQPAPTRMFTGLVPESLQIDDRMNVASAELGLPYHSLKAQLCNAQGCIVRVGDQLPDDLIVFDDGHLTAAGARFVMASGLGPRIDSLLAGPIQGK
jgi:peptidoglycan/LPS O-acetylase OafA/YrhL